MFSMVQSSLRFRGVPVFDRDLGDAQARPGLRDQARRRRDAEPRGEASALVEEEGLAVLAHQLQRPPGEQHDLRGAVMRQRPGDLRRAPAVDEQQVAGERHPLQRVHPGAGGGDERAAGRADVPRDRDGGIEQAAALLPRRRDARHGVRLLQPPPGALAGLGFQPRQLARAFHPGEPRLDLFQQVGLGHRPGGAAHAQVLRGRGPRQCRREQQGGGKDRGERASHRAASDRPVPEAGAMSSRTSSGPVSGPSRPSHGISGMATARPRIRSRGTRPISA